MSLAGIETGMADRLFKRSMLSRSLAGSRLGVGSRKVNSDGVIEAVVIRLLLVGHDAWRDGLMIVASRFTMLMLFRMQPELLRAHGVKDSLPLYLDTNSAGFPGQSLIAVHYLAINPSAGKMS